MPGFYHLKIVYGHLGTNNLTSVSKTFFYLNIQELVIILIILFVIFKAIKKLSSHKAKAKTQPNLQHRP
jgi:amino acid permease